MLCPRRWATGWAGMVSLSRGCWYVCLYSTIEAGAGQVCAFWSRL